jgi:hypothetical protein
MLKLIQLVTGALMTVVNSHIDSTVHETTELLL